MQLIPVRVDAKCGKLFTDIITPDENGRAAATFLEGDGSAQHNFFLGFGEDDALGVRACTFIGHGEHRSRRVQTRTQAVAILIHVEDRLACNT